MPLETVSSTNFMEGFSTDKLVERFQNAQANPPASQTPAAPAQQAPAQQTQQQPAQQTPHLQTPAKPEVSTEDILKQFENRNAPAAAPADPAKPEDPAAVKVEDDKVEGEKPAEEADKKKGGRPPEKIKIPEKPSELVALLEERGVLKGFADGKYETLDDLADLIKANDEAKITEFRTQAQTDFYNNMSPAMQFVAKYADKIRDPMELQPFLVALDNIKYSAELNPEVPEHQEEIIRHSLEIKGLPADAIESDIKDFRERGILADRAKTLKPVLDRYNQQQAAQMIQQKEQEEREQHAFWQQHQQNVYEQVVKSQTVSGLKLKKQDKDLVFAALGQPDPQLGGLPIYAIIDNLIQKKDFATLAEIVLVGVNKKGYREYVGSEIKAEVSETAQRALRTGATSTPVTVDQTTPETGKLARPVQKEWFSSYKNK